MMSQQMMFDNKNTNQGEDNNKKITPSEVLVHRDEDFPGFNHDDDAGAQPSNLHREKLLHFAARNSPKTQLTSY